MSMTFTLTDEQVEQFMVMARASVDAHVEAEVEPVSPTICFEYSVIESTWVAEVHCGNKIEELGAVAVTEQ